MKILFVAMPQSIHTVRWIRQLDGLGWDIHLFPVPFERTVKIHPELRNVTVHDMLFGRPDDLHESVKTTNAAIGCFPKGLPRFLKRRAAEKMVEHFAPREQRLATTIKQLKPDIIHSLELLGAGHLAFQGIQLLPQPTPPWIATNWGSELYYLARQDECRQRAVDVLRRCDYYTCECHRDVELARQFGFKGEVPDVLPCAGGIDLKAVAHLKQPGRTSDRRIIALKGYQEWVGRALVGLRAIESCAHWLQDYKVVIYSADTVVIDETGKLAERTGLKFEVMPPSSHEQILKLHGRARVSIGLSISDAISTSFLEAIAMGSFPIQSNTSCANEWIECGRSGFLVEPEDEKAVAASLTRALTDDAMVDRSAEINAQVVAEKLDESVVKPRVIAIYESIAAGRTA